jgi:hypothetical protein
MVIGSALAVGTAFALTGAVSSTQSQPASQQQQQPWSYNYGSP